MIGIMSRKGNFYDNVYIEPFHGILERELVVYQTR